MSKPRLQAPQFFTITDADWCREIQAARARGREDGNVLLARIRAAVALQTLQKQDAQPAKQKATAPADGVRK